MLLKPQFFTGAFLFDYLNSFKDNEFKLNKGCKINCNPYECLSAGLYYSALTLACAAASLAIGTRKGEQLT